MAILGIDEVGRGPWAGPLVVGAVVLCGEAPEGLTDSKKLTRRRREALSAEIYASGAAVGLGWVSASEIDAVGLGEALRLATRRAVEGVCASGASFHEIVIDGTVNFLSGTSLERHVSILKKADLLVPEVSAASIVAKVARDRYMIELAEQYPDYGFDKHVGYGTAAHRAALDKYGATREHRASFKPVTQAATTTKQLGDRAEAVVASHLEYLGHEIIARNWKTHFCEIDIVSRAGEHVYFTEVKYRAGSDRGDGLAMVTSKKQQRMRFAAESFMKHHRLHASPILAVAAVSGPDFTLDTWFPLS